MFASVGRLGGQGRHESRTQLRRLEGLLRSIFSVNEGAWYDFAIPYLYDTSTGVAQVDAAEDPIGLLIDRRLGAGLGAELCAFSSLTSQGTGWVFSDGVLHKNVDDATLYDIGTSVVAGKTYEIRYTKVNHTAGDPTITVGGTAYVSIIANAEADGSYVLRLQAGGNGIISLTGTAARIDFTSISVKLLDGNHAIQATAAARPTYRVDAAGRPYGALLGTDDNVVSGTGGGGSAGFFFCAAMRPTGGAGTVRVIYSDLGTNTGYAVRLDSANKLLISCGDGAAITSKASTATVDVGTDYVLTAWDDGTNLNVQINNGIVESVARPVVVAGTASFTIGKFNGGASQYLIADVYHMSYAKDTGLTAAQRRTEQLYAASKIGITL